MATKDNAAEEFVMVSDPTSIDPETKIVFDVVGDSFTGTYLGMRTVESDTGSYQQIRLQLDDEIFFTNANASLKQGLKTVRIGSKVRLTWVSELDTGQINPMRVFTVEVARKQMVSRNPST